MLVLLSDVHLTDKSSGKTIGPKAFRKFTESIENMAGSPDAKIDNIGRERGRVYTLDNI